MGYIKIWGKYLFFWCLFLENLLTNTFEDRGTNLIPTRGSIQPSANNTNDLGAATFRWDDATNGTINTSDLRDKERITDLDYGLAEVLQLRPVRFYWKNEPENEAKLGLIAQEILPVINEVVKTHDWVDADETEAAEKVQVEMERMGVYYSDLIPVLIKAIQEQQALIDAQNQRMDDLESRLNRLEQE